MARPKKQTVDYFPHQCTHGKTMYILEQKYGNDGYAFWFKLLEMLGTAEGHYLKLENPVDWEFLTAKTRLSGETCEEILNLLVKLEAIDAEAWEQRTVWCEKFVENVKDAYRNRTVEIPKKPDCLRKKPHKEEDNQRQESANEMKVNEMKKEKDTGDFFDTIWNLYPRKKGKGQVSDTQKKKLYKIGQEHLERCIKRFVEEMEAEERPIEKYPYGSTFFNSGYIDYLDENYAPQQQAKGPSRKVIHG